MNSHVEGPDLAALAGLPADSTRASFCLALLDGLDWTERRPHLAGTVGAGLCRHAFDSRWITRIGTGRAVALTDDGRLTLRHHLGLSDVS